MGEGGRGERERGRLSNMFGKVAKRGGLVLPIFIFVVFIFFVGTLVVI